MILQGRTVPEKLVSALAADGTRPLVTFYDDVTGERVELSVATFDNWVAKTANLLRDGLDARPGSRVGLLLPLHWQTAVWLVACWSTGVVAEPGATDADIVVADARGLEAAGNVGARNVVGLSLAPLGRPLEETPTGVLDYALEVPSYGDRFTSRAEPGPDDAALKLGDRTLLHRELVETAGLQPGDRLLTTLAVDTIDGVRAAIAAPVTANASVVLCRNPDAEQLVHRMTAERVSLVAGTEQRLPAGVRRFG